MFSRLYMLRSLERLKGMEKCLNITKRFVQIEVADLEMEHKLKFDNFEEYYSKIQLPYKMERYRDNESKTFVKLRVEEFKHGYKPLSLEQYSELYETIECPDKKRQMIEDINLIIIYYNRIISRSIFSPRTIDVDDMKKMMFDYPDYAARLRYINFLFVREFDIWRNAVVEEKNSEERRLKREKEEAEFGIVGCFGENNELQYGYWRNGLFGRYYKKPLQELSLHKLRQAQMFGQKLVIDCSFDVSMADYETQSVARQIGNIYSENRYSKDPFKLLYTGFDSNSRGLKYTQKQFSKFLNDPKYYFNLHTETYSELCKGEKLIYLSPDARPKMTKFDPDAVYIIGALVSKTMKSQMTYDKAKAEGIECLRLPIHEYVTLKPGVKRVLSFEGVFRIINHLKENGDWESAFRYGIQEHKLFQPEEDPLKLGQISTE